MPEWGIQVILFLFGGGFLFSGFRMIQSNQPWPSISIYGFTALIIFVAGVGPDTIKTLGAKWGSDGGQFGFERYQPTKREREIALKLGPLKLAQGEPPLEIDKKGKEFIKEAKKRSPEQRSPEDYLALAAEKSYANDYDAALADVFAGLALNPKDVRIKATLVILKGDIYVGLGLEDRGIKFYKEAIMFDPKYSLPYNNLGIIYGKQEKLEEAEKEFNKAIKLDPKNAISHFNLGNIYYRRGNLKESEEAYKKAIGFEPKYANPHYGLGNVYFLQRKLTEAEEEFKKAIGLNPKYANPHNGLGNIYREQGKLDEAEVEFKKAIELDPKKGLNHFTLGYLYEKQGKVEKAKSEYKKAIEFDPKNANPHSRLGMLFHQKGKLDEAEVEYKKAIELDPANDLPHGGLGNIYEQQGKLKEAKIEYEKALQLNPGFSPTKEVLEKLKRRMEKEK